jgi:hypothetical protein
VAIRVLRNSKNSVTRSGVGGGNTAAESSPTCREALNSSTGQASRTPNAASISPALRACRNRWKPLKICTYSRRVDVARPATASSPTTRSMSSAVTSHAGRPSADNARSSSPMSLSTVTGLNPRARHDATNASTHSAWNSHGSAGDGPAGATPPSITRSPGPATGPPSSRLEVQGGTWRTSEPPRTPTTTRRGRYGQVAGKIRSSEQVPAPDSWGEILGDTTVAAAMLDRLLHCSVVLNLDGDSYRLRDHHARNDTLRRATTGNTRRPLS